jgi:hypothetical protein
MVQDIIRTLERTQAEQVAELAERHSIIIQAAHRANIVLLIALGAITALFIYKALSRRRDNGASR